MEIVELGGDEVASIEEIDGVVREERLEYREEQVQFARNKGIGEEHRVLTALALLEEVISAQLQQNLDGINTRVELLKSQFWKLTKRAKFGDFIGRFGEFRKVRRKRM